MLGSKKNFVLTEEQTQGPGHSIPMFGDESDTTWLSRCPFSNECTLIWTILLYPYNNHEDGVFDSNFYFQLIYNDYIPRIGHVD